jgi:hypothetical protein
MPSLPLCLQCSCLTHLGVQLFWQLQVVCSCWQTWAGVMFGEVCARVCVQCVSWRYHTCLQRRFRSSSVLHRNSRKDRGRCITHTVLSVKC